MQAPPPWRRWIAEGLLIVVSILLAFAIDAAWEAREEGRQREALIEALRSDLEIAASALERARRLNTAARDAMGDLLVQTESGRLGASSRAAVDSLLMLSLAGGRAAPPTGTLETLFSSGKLDLIDDPEVVTRLTAWTGLLAERRSQDRWIGEGIVDLTELMGSTGVDPARILGTTGELERLAGDVPGTPWRGGPTEAWQVVHTPAYRAQLSLMWFIYNNSIRNIDRMLSLVEETLPRLRLQQDVPRG